MANNSKQYKLAIQIAGKVQSSFNASVDTAQSKMNALGTVAAKAAQIAAAAWGAVKLTQFIDDAVDTYANFEQEMANSAAIAGATGQDFTDLQAAALEMGKKTTKSATEAAQALGYMALAGWDTQQSISGLEPILRLSEATQMDLGRASDLVTDSMSALGIGVDGMMDYLNLCVQTNNKANTSAEQLMEAFIGCGGTARATGVDLTDLSTALGILANNGTKGAEAGTALNSILVRMTTKDVAIKAMRDLGVSVYDASGNFRGLETILGDISQAMAGMNTEAKAAAMADIAGTNYYTKMSYLLAAMSGNAETAEEYLRAAGLSGDELAAALENSSNAWEDLEGQLAKAGEGQGALMNMANQVTDTWQAARDIFNSAVDDMKIRLVQNFAPYAKTAIKAVADVIPNITDAIVVAANAFITWALPKIQQFATTAQEIFQRIKPYLLELRDAAAAIFQKVQENWPAIQQVFSAIISTVENIIQIVWRFRGALVVAAAAFAGLKAGLAIQSVVQGFQKAQIALKLFTAASGSAKLAQAALNGTLTLGETIVGILTGQITIAQLATAAWTKVTTALNAVLAANPIALVVMGIVALIAIVVLLYTKCEWFRNAVHAVIDAVVGFVKNAATAISVFFSRLWAGIQSVWSTVSGWFSQYVITPLVNFFSPIVERISGFFRGCWIIIQAVWRIAGTWFQNSVITPLVSFFNAAKDVISGIFSGLWEGIKAVWSVVSSWFQNSVITPLVSFFSPIVETIGGFFSNLWANIVNVWQAAGTWFMENVATPINNAFQAVSDFVRGIVNGLLGIVEGMLNRIIGAVNTFIGGFNGLVSKAASFIGVEWQGIETVPEVTLPRLATGGIVTAPTILEAGEGGEPEAVLPLSKLARLLQAFQLPAAAQIPALATGGIVTAPTILEAGEGKEPEAILPLSKLSAFLQSFLHPKAAQEAETAAPAAEKVTQIPRLATGGIVTAPTILEAGEGGEPEAVLPFGKLSGIIQQAVASIGAPSIIQQAAESINAPSIIPDLLNRLLGERGGGEPEPAPADGPPMQIYYSPQYSFAGGAPTKSDLVEAEKMSQAEFARYMEQWERNRKRTKF